MANLPSTSVIGKMSIKNQWIVALSLAISIMVIGFITLDRVSVTIFEPRVVVGSDTIRPLHSTLWTWPVQDPSTLQYQAIGEFVGPYYACQTFLSRHSNLYHIEVMLFDYGRKNTGDLIFHLRLKPNASQDIITMTLDPSLVKDHSYYPITFSPISDSAGRSYAFCLEAPGADLVNSVTAMGFLYDTYPDGKAIFHGMWGKGIGVRDLDFRLGYKPVMSVWQKLALLSQRLPQSKPLLCGSLWLYILLGIAYLVLLYLLFVNTIKQSANDSS